MHTHPGAWSVPQVLEVRSLVHVLFENMGDGRQAEDFASGSGASLDWQCFDIAGSKQPVPFLGKIVFLYLAELFVDSDRDEFFQ